MTSIYTRENFTADVIPSQFDQRTKNLIRMAVGVGWSLLVTKRGHCTLKACPPNEHVTINLRSHRSAEGPMKGLVKKVNKYANPVLAVKDEPPATKAEEDAYIGQIADRFIKTEAAAQARRDEAEAERERKQERLAQGKAARERLHKQAAKQIAAAGSVSTEPRTITSEGPMIARRSQGHGYPSPTTWQVDYLDGGTVYQCRFEGCDFESENRRGPGAHYPTHGVPVPEQPPPMVMIPEHEPAYHKDGYTPRVDRVRALAAVLRKAMEAGIDWNDLDAAAQTLAAEALEWAHEQSTESGLLSAEREPLTAEEMLTRIRNMLDNGEYLAQRAEIADLRTRMAEVEQREKEAVEQATDLQETLDTLRELIPTKKETA